MRHSTRIAAAICAAGCIVLLTACATGPGGSEDEGPSPRPGRGARGPARPREGDAWRQYDVNGDEKVTRSEFLAVRHLCFVRYDANEDGILTQAEIRRRLPARLAGEIGPVIAGMDRDGDGEVSRVEYDQASDRLFQFLDTNHDGVIAGMELTALTSGPPGDICHSSGPRDAGGGRGMGEPGGGPGARPPR